MADSVGQAITPVAHFMISLSVAFLFWTIAGSDFNAMRVLFCGAVGVGAGILMIHGQLSGGFVRGFLFDRIWHLVLPVLCLTFGGFAFLAKLSRSSILENLAADYARTARAKGATDEIVLWRHVFRNSLIPLITVAASLLPGLLAGSVIVESLFSIEGMGKLAVSTLYSLNRQFAHTLNTEQTLDND